MCQTCDEAWMEYLSIERPARESYEADSRTHREAIAATLAAYEAVERPSHDAYKAIQRRAHPKKEA